MMKREVILAAIDHASDLERMMAAALGTGGARGADIHLIRVMPSRAVPESGDQGLWVLEPHDDRVHAGARLASMAPSAGPDGVRVHHVMLRGTPEQVIPAYAQLHDAALLIVERDYGIPRFWRNGRVVNRVAHHSPIQMLVLPARGRRAPARPELRRILAPTDFSIASAVALRRAVELSRRHGARLTLLHAVTDVPRHTAFSGSEAWEVIRRLPARLDATAQRLRRQAAFFGAADIATEVATGDAHGAILEVANRSDADLVVMGIAHRSWVDRALFGSTLRRVLRRASAPVLVVPVVAGAHTWPSEPVVARGGAAAVSETAGERLVA